MDNHKKKSIDIPVWHKINLTLDEASEMSCIGINRLRELSNEPGCQWVLFVGDGVNPKRLVKRVPFIEWINSKAKYI